jgi:hypothetical protein
VATGFVIVVASIVADAAAGPIVRFRAKSVDNR